MTDSEALADEDLAMARDAIDSAGSYDPAGYDPAGYDEGPFPAAEPDYPDVDWDSYDLDEWNTTHPAQPEQEPPSAPWFANPRLLFGLIAMAAAVLVVATVLLITGKDSGEIPTAPQLSTKSTPETTGGHSVPRPPSESASSTSASVSTSAESSSAPAEPAAPAEPEQPAASPSAPPPSAGQSKSPAGPKVNVTRTPMSFTPGKH
jgi:hypothetical protein